MKSRQEKLTNSHSIDDWADDWVSVACSKVDRSVVLQATGGRRKRLSRHRESSPQIVGCRAGTQACTEGFSMCRARHINACLYPLLRQQCLEVCL